ncbi:hypothetical protein OPV22_029826 [Ensete ventricosum]|uniref:Uncharacterized protein n=1 Tax=Ensete ventricosum TaxID=4639 RepID=A0AAV8QES1_ENSVE|nr:hypothetical protein OPV22_029826 [Ensete ventricosum]
MVNMISNISCRSASRSALSCDLFTALTCDSVALSLLPSLSPPPVKSMIVASSPLVLPIFPQLSWSLANFLSISRPKRLNAKNSWSAWWSAPVNRRLTSSGLKFELLWPVYSNEEIDSMAPGIPATLRAFCFFPARLETATDLLISSVMSLPIQSLDDRSGRANLAQGAIGEAVVGGDPELDAGAHEMLVAGTRPKELLREGNEVHFETVEDAPLDALGVGVVEKYLDGHHAGGAEMALPVHLLEQRAITHLPLPVGLLGRERSASATARL